MRLNTTEPLFQYNSSVSLINVKQFRGKKLAGTEPTYCNFQQTSLICRVTCKAFNAGVRQMQWKSKQSSVSFCSSKHVAVLSLSQAVSVYGFHVSAPQKPNHMSLGDVHKRGEAGRKNCGGKSTFFTTISRPMFGQQRRQFHWCYDG